MTGRIRRAQASGLVGDRSRVAGGDGSSGESRPRASKRAGQQSSGDELVVHNSRRAVKGGRDLLAPLVGQGDCGFSAAFRIVHADVSTVNMVPAGHDEGACLEPGQPCLGSLQVDEVVDGAGRAQEFRIQVEERSALEQCAAPEGLVGRRVVGWVVVLDVRQR
jgi:hypothetical protein